MKLALSLRFATIPHAVGRRRRPSEAMASLSSRLSRVGGGGGGGGGWRGGSGSGGDGLDAPSSPPSSSSYDNSKRKRPGLDPTSRSKATRAFLFLVGVLLVLGIVAGRQRPKRPAWLPKIFRRERVAVLTVASYQPRKPLGEAAADARDDVEYGASKARWLYPLSIDNKARYCNLHQYDLNVDVDTGDSGGEKEVGTHPTTTPTTPPHATSISCR